MKKLCAILMAALVLLMATGAMADTSTVARSGALAAYLDGKSYQEIAKMLGRHSKSIDNALQRVKRKLEKFLSEHANE